MERLVDQAAREMRGVGESGTVASTPSVVNAILDALTPARRHLPQGAPGAAAVRVSAGLSAAAGEMPGGFPRRAA